MERRAPQSRGRDMFSFTSRSKPGGAHTHTHTRPHGPPPLVPLFPAIRSRHCILLLALVADITTCIRFPVLCPRHEQRSSGGLGGGPHPSPPPTIQQKILRPRTKDFYFFYFSVLVFPTEEFVKNIVLLSVGGVGFQDLIY